MRLSLIALLLFVSTASAQQGLPVADHAVALALADAETLPPADRPFARFLWIQDADLETAQALSHAVNLLSRTSLIHRPVPLGKDKLLVLRIDVRHYASRAADLAAWLNAWEELRFDPAFSLLLTKDTLKFAVGLAGNPLELVRPMKSEGKITFQKVGVKDVGESVVLRVLPPDVDPQALQALQQAVVSTAPIVSADYFVARALASIRDEKLFDGIYASIYGGLYYDFAGIPADVKDGRDLDQLLENLGVGSVKAKVRAADVFDKLRSDKRVACFRSKVAGGRPRRIDFLPILAGDVFASKRFLALTFDLKRANVDIGVHPVLNLLKTLRNADASEGIWTLGNGLNGYALWNGDGKRQEKAPDDVVSDHSVPAPYYRELQAPISCMSCHEASGLGGWQPVANDVAKLLAGRKGGLRLDIPADFGAVDQVDALDRIAGLFAGDAEQLLVGARDDFAAAVLRCTGPWAKSKRLNKDVVQLSSGRLVDLWRDYHYGDVDARRALRDAGWDVPAEKAAEVLDRLTPPVGQTEDVRIAAIKAGLVVGRAEFDLIRRLIAARVQETVKANPKLIEGMK